MLFRLQRTTHFIKVSHFFALSSLKRHISSTRFVQEPQSNPPQSNKFNIDGSSIRVSGIPELVIGEASDLFLKTTQLSTTNVSSLEELLLSVSSLNPRITRKFWRKSRLEPQHVLELLLAFESDVGKLGIDVKKVESLLGIFKWASSSSKQGRNFKHLDQSFKIMVGLLVRVGLFEDAECLLLAMDKEGILLDNHEIFSDMIEWHVSLDNLERTINLYGRMRGLNLVPSLSCYRNLLNYLVHHAQIELLLRVYDDILEMGISEKDINENVIQVLCRFGKIQESRNVIKKAFACGIKPTSLVLDMIASGYCEKKDYNDLLSLFVETKCIPNVVVANKIIHSMCQNFGVEKAFVFFEELEHLGFIPDAITLGILIGWNCREGNLRNAFVCLSNVLSRGVKPHIYSYNAIISAVFKQGMWIHAKDIVLEMDDEGMTLDLSTFRVLLAGYCKSRQFDEVKVMIKKMVDNGLIELSPLQDPISKAFMLLGIDPLTVRIRRDNDVKFSKSEFYDSMGNGLYLEGNVVYYDQVMTSILDDSMIPDYNRLVIKDDLNSCYKTAVEMIHWGQKLSISSFSTLLKKFHVSNSGFKAITTFLENMPYLCDDLDEEMYNLLLQAQLKRGFVRQAKKTYDEMVKKNLEIDHKTHTALVTGLRKKRNSKNFLDKMNGADLVPENINYDNLIKQMCSNGRTNKALDLLDAMLKKGNVPDSTSYDCLIQDFCVSHEIEDALDLYVEMLNRKLKPDIKSLEVVIEKLSESGRTCEAEKVIDDMICRGETPSKAMFVTVASRYRVARNFGKASEVLQRMQEFGYKPDFETHWSFISSLSRVSDKDEDDKSRSFLSTLLSDSGFNLKKVLDPKSK